MRHKFSRKELGAKKNYYELLQIAHLINQLAEKLQRVKDQLQASKLTMTALWQDMMSCMRKESIETTELQIILEEYKQLRY